MAILARIPSFDSCAAASYFAFLDAVGARFMLPGPAPELQGSVQRRQCMRGCHIPARYHGRELSPTRRMLSWILRRLPTHCRQWVWRGRSAAKHKRENPAAIMKDARRVLNDMPPWVRASRDADQDILLALLDRYTLQALRAPVQCALARVLSEGVAPIT
jgi:hypothetical protein